MTRNLIQVIDPDVLESLFCGCSRLFMRDYKRVIKTRTARLVSLFSPQTAGDKFYPEA